MKAIRIKARQDMAQYRIHPWTDRKRTYPLPPYSTVIGMIHAACGWEKYHPLQVSVQGKGYCDTEMASRWVGGHKSKKLSNDFLARWSHWVHDGDFYIGYTKTPKIEDFMTEMELLIHIAPENQDDVKGIYNKILYPPSYLSLGRHEDILQIDSVDVTKISHNQKMVEQLDLWSYVPVDIMELYRIEQVGIVYDLNKNYIVRNNRRVFNKVRTMLIEKDPSGQQVYALHDESDNPVFFA